jgi:hypothetical protein
MITVTATNQPLHRPTPVADAPKGRSFLNDALEEAATRRTITARAPWATPDTDDLPPAPGEESRKAMSAAVREAAGYTEKEETARRP